MAIIDLKFCTIELAGANTEPALLTIEIGTGTLEYTEKRAIEIVKRRGLLETAREGDEQEMTVTFQFVWELLTAPNAEYPPTIEDVLKHQGNAAGWLSTNPDPDAPFCVDIRIIYTPPCPYNDDQWETILLARFHYEELAHSISDGSIDCKGRCLATAAVISPSVGLSGGGGGTTPPLNTNIPTPAGDVNAVGTPFTVLTTPAITWQLFNDLTTPVTGYKNRQLVSGNTMRFDAVGTDCYINAIWNGEQPNTFVWTVDGGPLQTSAIGTPWAFQGIVVPLFQGLSDAPHSIVIEASTDWTIFDSGLNTAVNPASFFLKIAGSAPAVTAYSASGTSPTELAAPLQPTDWSPSTDGNYNPWVSATGTYTQVLAPAATPTIVTLGGTVWSPPSLLYYGPSYADHVTACLDVIPNAASSAGIFIEQGVGGGTVYFAKGPGNQVGLFQLGTIPGPPLLHLASVAMSLADARWMRIADSLYQVSPDGTNWTTIATHDRGAYNAQHSGVFQYNPNGATGTSTVTVSNYYAVISG